MSNNGDPLAEAIGKAIEIRELGTMWTEKGPEYRTLYLLEEQDSFIKKLQALASEIEDELYRSKGNPKGIFLWARPDRGITISGPDRDSEEPGEWVAMSWTQFAEALFTCWHKDGEYWDAELMRGFSQAFAAMAEKVEALKDGEGISADELVKGTILSPK